MQGFFFFFKLPLQITRVFIELKSQLCSQMAINSTGRKQCKYVLKDNSTASEDVHTVVCWCIFFILVNAWTKVDFATPHISRGL